MKDFTKAVAAQFIQLCIHLTIMTMCSNIFSKLYFQLLHMNKRDVKGSGVFIYYKKVRGSDVKQFPRTFSSLRFETAKINITAFPVIVFKVELGLLDIKSGVI